MKTSFEHLPKNHQDKLKIITDEIKKVPWVEMVILFWSFARWDYVEKDITYVDGHHEEFQSDYDIMVVMKNDELERKTNWYNLVKEINKKPIFKDIKEWKYQRPIKIISESISELNEKLRDDRYFYSDMKKDGIMMFDSWNCTLEKAKIFTPEEKLKMQKNDFESWFKSSNVFFQTYKFNFENWDLNESAFQLHQSAERYITTYLLVINHYKPKEHDIAILHREMCWFDWDFYDWFDLDDEYENDMLILLRRSYVDSRYNKNFKITKEELEFLEKKVVWLKDRVEDKCGKIINN